MTSNQILELTIAAALFLTGVVLYRRRSAVDASHGSQGAVLLFVIAVILAIHGSGLLEYRPSAAELQ
jgi:hypothetical protein